MGMRFRGPPLAVQIGALLLGGLVVAQLVTLAMTLLLPPAPAPEYGLDDIAGALRGRGTGGLERVVQAGPPDLSGPGWLTSERSRRDLARLLGAEEGAVSLSFWTPLPFAGTAAARPVALKAGDGPYPDVAATAFERLGTDGVVPDARLVLAQFPGAPPPGGQGGPPPGAPPGGAPTDLPPRAGGPPPRDALPPGTGAIPPASGTLPPVTGEGGFSPRGGLFAIRPGPLIPGDGGVAVPPLLRGPVTPPAATILPPITARPEPLVTAPLTLPQILPPVIEQAPPAAEPPRVRALPVPPADFSDVAPPPAIAPDPSGTAAGAARAEADTPALPVRAPERGLFGLAAAPFVQGDFVAALQLADGRWAVVQPAAEPFPNAWQRRVLIWFAVALAIVGPLGWLFARRLSLPLARFADAATRLGQDPAAPVMAPDGPAEIGRAARSFNIMQSRLRAFLDDRTAMIGAISHDLRTPLTRMRFRIEEVDDDAVREGLAHEVGEMEAMIGGVLDFIRDATSAGLRERLDLAALAEDVVEDAVMIGGDVGMERAEPAPVDIDPMGVRRLLDNLIENAVKYGGRARVRVVRDAERVVAEVVDAGPGLPEADLERAFEPFWRSDAARASAPGSGFGLAVCRSIARAHGGDVTLGRVGDGFAARLSLPLAAAG